MAGSLFFFFCHAEFISASALKTLVMLNSIQHLIVDSEIEQFSARLEFGMTASRHAEFVSASALDIVYRFRNKFGMTTYRHVNSFQHLIIDSEIEQFSARLEFGMTCFLIACFSVFRVLPKPAERRRCPKCQMCPRIHLVFLPRGFRFLAFLRFPQNRFLLPHFLKTLPRTA